MSELKYLDYEGLQHYHSKIKDYTDAKISEVEYLTMHIAEGDEIDGDVDEETLII